MSTSGAQARLDLALKDLQARWRRTQTSWNDETSRQFEATYQTPLASRLRQAAEATGKLDAALSRLHRDCD